MSEGPERPGVDRWERLRDWIQRKIDQMGEGDFERLPPTFSEDGGRRASEAYETVLIAMEVIEGRRTREGAASPDAKDADNRSVSGTD